MSTSSPKHDDGLSELRERLLDAETGRAAAVAEANAWKQKLIAVAESYRKRSEQLSRFAASLGRQRSAQERERIRLATENRRLHTENLRLSTELERLREKSLARFLGRALDLPADREHRLEQAGLRTRR